jgi:non-ribosomal peptide synthetase component F
VNLIEHFDKGVEIDPERVCVLDARVTKTYPEVQRNSYRIAHALIAMGVEPGARVALLRENTAASSNASSAFCGRALSGYRSARIKPWRTRLPCYASVEVEFLLYTRRLNGAANEIIRDCAS